MSDELPGALPAAGGVRNQRRGHLRVFLGMAAGVGKTFRMLLEGHAEQEAGRDVVIGLVESHGRAETEALAEGLPIVPRRRVVYRGAELEEMDLPGILRRAPELCLIDEIAHTNAPGLEHAKRYEDVEDVLAAGIDVLSTMNVQHLDSLNDRIAELTGVRVRETIPDDVLGRADEVVMIDLTPEALLDRLRAGKVYPPERIGPALNNFFRIENLAALREVALRQVAEEVGHKRLTTEHVGSREEGLAADAPQAVGERLLALVEPYPAAQRLVRRAWRSAQRLGADLDLLWVSPPSGNPSEDEERSLAALRQLASVLGARLLVEESDNVAAAVADVAQRQGTTYILMGGSRPARGLARLRTPLPQRLMELLPGVDVRIVADRARRGESSERLVRGDSAERLARVESGDRPAREGVDE
jgi:two-component system, OmpR family, sensor histidine kinase KdpD